MEINISNGVKNEYFNIKENELPDFDRLAEYSHSKRKINKIIQNLDLSSDAKAVLYSISDSAIKIGEILVPLGRTILSAALELLKIFPTLTLAIILAKFLPLLVPAWMVKIKLTALIASLLPFLGAYTDIKDNIINNRFGEVARDIAQKFFPKEQNLNAH
ncbi:hypothetical protein N8338_01780 [Amylibacter sp.]|nr:hypothetical protein [Amylibacter sp.]MDC1455787.1 hypothetical protein [Amylibacter sp.]